MDRQFRQQAMVHRYIAGETLQQIGDYFGLSRERVRQILADAGVVGREVKADRAVMRQEHEQSTRDQRAQQKHKEREAKFWSLVNTNTESGCWEWLGKVYRGTLPCVRWDNQNIVFFRLAYYLTKGEWLPKGAHRVCRNKTCCNPDHVNKKPQTPYWAWGTRKKKRAD